MKTLLCVLLVALIGMAVAHPYMYGVRRSGYGMGGYGMGGYGMGGYGMGGYGMGGYGMGGYGGMYGGMYGRRWGDRDFGFGDNMWGNDGYF